MKLEVGGLSDDSRVRAKALEYSRGSEAAVLLVRDGGKDNVAAQGKLAGLRDRRHTRRETCFHIEGAAPVQLAVSNGRFEGSRHACCSDRIEVGVQHQGAPAARSGCDRDDAWATLGGFQPVGLQTLRFAPVTYQNGQRRFSWSFC